MIVPSTGSVKNWQTTLAFKPFYTTKWALSAVLLEFIFIQDDPNKPILLPRELHLRFHLKSPVMPTDNKVKPMSWVYISLGGFILFIACAVVLVVYGKKLEITLPVYFFLLVVAALSATGFLTGALRSQARYSGKVYNGNLYLTGPILVFVIIVFLGYKFRPQTKDGPLTLTLNLFGPAGRSEAITSGSVKVLFENDARVENISSEGQAVFGQIDPSFKNKQVRIIPQVNKFLLPTGDTLVTLPDKEFATVDIQLQKQKEKTLIRGLITTDNGTPINKALVQFQQFGKSVSTNEQGNFEIEIPLAEGTETDIVIYIKNVIKYRNKMTVTETITIPVPD